MNVSAKDKATGKQQSIVIKASSGLSEDEIQKMVADAESHADEDRKFEELVSVRNQGDQLVHATRKSLTELEGKLSSEEKASVEAAIKELEEVLQGSDKQAIEGKINALAQASAPLAQKAQEAAAAQADGQAQQTSGADKADDVVDAEFEEVKDDKK